MLTKISKLKGFEVLSEWIQPCVNHLHWSATTTPSGDGNIILAKFKSFLGHIVNKHKDLENPLFDKCAHGDDISQRKWHKKGLHSSVYQISQNHDTHSKKIPTILNIVSTISLGQHFITLCCKLVIK